MKKILVVAAHPDDEILGCGGTVARLAKEGNMAYVLILGEGITSRDGTRDRRKRGRPIAELKRQMQKADKAIGVKKTFVHDFPDNRFDEVPLLDFIKVVEDVCKKVSPDIIFTHYKEDLNIDHRVTYNAVLTASRPIKDSIVKEIYSFEIPSSTEWNSPLTFSPDVFFDITSTLGRKLVAIKFYKGELRHFPHPRSAEGIRVRAAYWGMCMGKKSAEAFKTVRILK